MDPEELKKLIEQQNTAFAEFRKANDERLAQIEKRGSADTVTVEKVERLNTELNRLDKALKEALAKVDDLEVRANRPGLPGGGGGRPEQVEHREAFGRFMRGGENGGLREIERRAMSASSDPDGGYLVPEETEIGIDGVLRTMSAMRRLARVQPIGASAYKRAVRTSSAGYSWAGEATGSAETSTPQLSELEFRPGTLIAEPRATLELLEDAAVDIGQWLTAEVTESFAEGESAAFITGNGVNKPRGILSYTPVANASYAWGKVGYIATGVSGGFASSNPSDKIIQLQHALRAGYRSGAAWLMNDSTLSTVRQFKDGQGLYLWQPALAAGVPSLLLGAPVEIDDNMPDLGADSYSIAWGNWRRAYIIVDRLGIGVLRDPYTANPYVKFVARKRVGGGIQHFEALKLLKFGTS